MTLSGQERYRFSEAPIWELQRTYYEQLGLQAWANDQVPQYITSNPMIGTAYAEIIFGFLQDRAQKGFTTEPVVVLELGAGVGRLAFHVLQQLCEPDPVCGRAAAAVPLCDERFALEKH